MIRWLQAGSRRIYCTGSFTRRNGRGKVDTAACSGGSSCPIVIPRPLLSLRALAGPGACPRSPRSDGTCSRQLRSVGGTCCASGAYSVLCSVCGKDDVIGEPARILAGDTSANDWADSCVRCACVRFVVMSFKRMCCFFDRGGCSHTSQLFFVTR